MQVDSWCTRGTQKANAGRVSGLMVPGLVCVATHMRAKHAACLLSMTLNDLERVGNVVLWGNLFVAWLLKKGLRQFYCLNCMAETHRSSLCRVCWPKRTAEHYVHGDQQQLCEVAHFPGHPSSADARTSTGREVKLHILAWMCVVASGLVHQSVHE